MRLRSLSSGSSAPRGVRGRPREMAAAARAVSQDKRARQSAAHPGQPAAWRMKGHLTVNRAETRGYAALLMSRGVFREVTGPDGAQQKRGVQRCHDCLPSLVLGTALKVNTAGEPGTVTCLPDRVTR